MINRVFLFLILFVFCFSRNIFADRDTATVTVYKATTLTGTLVQRGDAKLYSVNFVATSANGYFVILNATSNTTSPSGSLTDIKTEGSEATSGNSEFQDYTRKPLEFSTGLFLILVDGYLILRYE